MIEHVKNTTHFKNKNRDKKKKYKQVIKKTTLSCPWRLISLFFLTFPAFHTWDHTHSICTNCCLVACHRFILYTDILWKQNRPTSGFSLVISGELDAAVYYLRLFVNKKDTPMWKTGLCSNERLVWACHAVIRFKFNQSRGRVKIRQEVYGATFLFCEEQKPPVLNKATASVERKNSSCTKL